MDARKLDFENVFDLVFSNAALHWVDDHLAFLNGAYRSLKQNGRLVTSCGGKGSAADVLQVFAEIISQKPWNQYFETFHNPYFFYGTEEYKRWLSATGFKVNRLELVPKEMTHSDRAGFTAWIRTTWFPFTQNVPEFERDRFISEVVEHYLDRIPLDELGRSHVRMIRLEVDALKA